MDNSTADMKLEAMIKLNEDFHAMVMEVQKTFSRGMPLNILALFFAIQVSVVAERMPEFPKMVIDEINKKTNKG